MFAFLILSAVNDEHANPLPHLRIRPRRLPLHIRAGENSAVGEIAVKKMIATIVAISSSLFALNSYAQTEYNYFDFKFEALEIDFETYQLNADGYSIAFTKDYADRFLLQAGFKRYLFDEHDLYRMRQDTYNLGVGLHLPLTEQYDVYGKILYAAVQSDLPSGKEDDQGLEAILGLRMMPLASFGIEASLKYVGYEDPISLTGPELSITGEARWYLSDLVSLGVGANYGEYETSWYGNFRISFDDGNE